jgi:hypothetical protein
MNVYLKAWYTCSHFRLIRHGIMYPWVFDQNAHCGGMGIGLSKFHLIPLGVHNVGMMCCTGMFCPCVCKCGSLKLRKWSRLNDVEYFANKIYLYRFFFWLNYDFVMAWPVMSFSVRKIFIWVSAKVETIVTMPLSTFVFYFVIMCQSDMLSTYAATH